MAAARRTNRAHSFVLSLSHFSPARYVAPQTSQLALKRITLIEGITEGSHP
jgi:hypothetical protein